MHVHKGQYNVSTAAECIIERTAHLGGRVGSPGHTAQPSPLGIVALLHLYTSVVPGGYIQSSSRLLTLCGMEVSETLSNGRSKELINRTFRPRRPSSAARTE